MTLHVTVPDTVYRQIAELATRQQVSVERTVAAALAEQLAGWSRMELVAERGSPERFLAALDKVPTAEPAPEDRFRPTPGAGVAWGSAKRISIVGVAATGVISQKAVSGQRPTSG